MKKQSVAAGVVATALLCSVPVSLDWSPARGGSPSLTLVSAAATELAIPARRSAHRYAGYYRGRSYDPYCGGPYVGGGWNGGTYWGGPWMELSCYGVMVTPSPNPVPNIFTHPNYFFD